MEHVVVETNELCKDFKSFHALKNVSIFLKKGRVYGLIGKNGAGKTTLMRILAGLSFQNTGSYTLFGASDSESIQKARKKIGCLIEYPSLNGNMTAKENITMHMIMRGITDANLADELLKMVGLEVDNKKRVKDYSLGMKQRLGIAVAMVGNPELLILDEPINGLDPIGVVEIRKLIRKLSEEREITVLISSHNLPELYQTATDYIIIDHGEVKKKLTLEQLEEDCQHYIVVKTKQVKELVDLLENKFQNSRYKVIEDGTVLLYDFAKEEEKLAEILSENRILTTKFSVEGDSLENYFIKMIEGEA